MKRTESEFIFAKFFDSYDESRANTKPTLGLLGVYQLFHDENGHWTLFKNNVGVDCDKHKDDDHAEMLIEAEDIFDMFRTLSEEQFTNHKKFYNKEFKYQEKEKENNVVIDALYELQKNHEPGDDYDIHIQKIINKIQKEN